MKNLVLISLITLLNSNAFATVCRVSVPSDLNAPLTFDKTLWTGTGDLEPGLHFIVDSKLTVVTMISEDESFDQTFLSKHNGEFAIALGKPFPADQVAGDQLIALSTIDTSAQYFRKEWINSVGNIGDGASQYGLSVTDISRHLSISCK